MKANIESKFSPDIISLAVNMFDNFLLEHIRTNNDLIHFDKFINKAAACAVLISSKFFHSKGHLTFSHFPYFKSSELIEFERYFLEIINYNIVFDNTVPSYIRHMLYIWPKYLDLHGQIFEEANSIVSSFQEFIESTLYMPHIIAISSLLITIEKYNIDSLKWTTYLPQICFQNNNKQLIDECIQCIRCPQINLCNISPTAISEGIPDSPNKTRIFNSNLTEEDSLKFIPMKFHPLT